MGEHTVAAQEEELPQNEDRQGPKGRKLCRDEEHDNDGPHVLLMFNVGGNRHAPGGEADQSVSG